MTYTDKIIGMAVLAFLFMRSVRRAVEIELARRKRHREEPRNE